MSHLLEPIPMERDAPKVIVLNVVDTEQGLDGFTIGEGKPKGEMIYNDFFVKNTQMFHLKLTGDAINNVVIDEYMKKSIQFRLSPTSAQLIQSIEGRLPASQKYKFYSIMKDGESIRLKLPERQGKQYYVHTGTPATEEIEGKNMEALVSVGLYTSPRNYGIYLTLQSLNIA